MKKALLIGINAYPPGNQLTGCIEDICCLEKAIARNGDGSLNFEVKKLADEAWRIDIFDIDTLEKNIREEGVTGVFAAANDNCLNTARVLAEAGNLGKYDISSSGSILSTGVSILVACREDEYAQEMGGHGLFTELLCNALKGGAADPTGYITMGGIYAYIDRSFGAWGQRPVFKTNVTEFAPIKTVVPEVSLDEIKKITVLFSDFDQEFQLNPSYEFTNDPKEKHEPIKPYANAENVEKFKVLQKLHGIGLVNPIGTDHMYFAAINSKKCKLTELGKYYWKLVKNNRI